MATYYYQGGIGFLVTGINAIPADAVEISAEEHRALLAAQAQGKVIQPGPDGRPVAVEPPAPSLEQLASAIRAERDRRLTASDRFVLPDYPHPDVALCQAWLDYRQALRDLPRRAGFPWAGPDDPACPWPEQPAVTPAEG